VIVLDELLRKLLGLRGPNDHMQRIEQILLAQLRLLLRIEASLNRPSLPAKFLEFFEIINGQEIRIYGMKNLFVDKQMKVLVKGFKDKLGNEASVDGLPAWSLESDLYGKLEVSADGMSAVFSPSGLASPKGSPLKVFAQADADLGEGVKTIVGFFEINLLPLEAVMVEMDGEEVIPVPVEPVI
jgi:hypothetical protein